MRDHATSFSVLLKFTVQLTVQQLAIVPVTDAPMKHYLYHEERCAPRAQPDLSRLRRQTIIPSGALVTSGSGVRWHAVQI